MTLRDHIEDLTYTAGIVWPARLAATSCVEAAGLVCRLAMACGMRRLAIRTAIWAYDIADHDPADATWELHRQRMPWAWAGAGVFRPANALAVAGWWS